MTRPVEPMPQDFRINFFDRILLRLFHYKTARVYAYGCARADYLRDLKIYQRERAREAMIERRKKQDERDSHRAIYGW